MGTLFQGAKNAVEVCMGVKSGEHVLIVTDEGTCSIGNALKRAAEKVTPYVEMYVLEDYGTRPMTSLPKEIEEAIHYAEKECTNIDPDEFDILRGVYARG